MVPLTRLTSNLYVHHGAINVGIVRDGRRAILIDYGNGDVQRSLEALGIERVEAVLFTHHHRDQASGAGSLVRAGTRFGVPKAEEAWFSDVESYWGDPAHRWHLYGFHPHNLMLAQSIPVHSTYREGDTIEWGTAEILVLETPGHTDGSASYRVDVGEGDGGERYLFCGDVLYGKGQVWDLYSLQKGWHTEDYHGFMGDRVRLKQSLRKLAAEDAVSLIPSHGEVVTDPLQAIDLLRGRLDACYEQYVAISALRHYFPGLFARCRGLEGALPIVPSLPCPDFLRHVGTSWIILSEGGAAFVVDCGSPEVVRTLREMRASGLVGEVEGLWISHYHDDHVDAVPEFLKEFNCPVVADEHVAQVIEDPLAWRLPCISPVQVEIDRRTGHGERWQWHEFALTAYHLPGQTFYHGGLLVEGRGTRILFVGDSFTPAGIDDYCAGNRNYLGNGVGFDACVALVRELEPDLLLNCHVDVGFHFTDQECDALRANLSERERSYGELLPWDHPNYGMDEHWVRCHPYEQRAAPGDEVLLRIVFTNHSSSERQAICRPVLSEAWGAEVAPQQVDTGPKSEGCATFAFAVPGDVAPGRWVLPVEVTYGGRPLGQFREAILVIAER